jgi:short subunit dehydrogenase-like uncharacterized protein
MMTNSNWMIYGATGYTGKLMAQEAVKQGFRPVLAGRSPQKLQPLAEKLGLEWVAVDLTDTAKLEQTLTGMKLVLNTAGPFGATAKPLVQACLNKGVDYLDIANEIEVYQLMLSFDRQAQERGIALISGVGFGTVVTNFLAKQAKDLLPEAEQLEVAIAPYNYTTEPAVGAEKTGLEVIAGGGKEYREGRLVSVRLAKTKKVLTAPDGSIHSLLSIPLGDLVAAQMVSGIPNVSSYLELSLSETSRRFMPLIQGVLKIKPLRKLLQRQIEQRAAKRPVAAPPLEARRSYGWVRVSNRKGESRELWLETGEGYEFTVRSSLKAVERLLEQQPGQGPKGALAPAQVFETDFAEKIEGTRLFIN